MENVTSKLLAFEQCSEITVLNILCALASGASSRDRGAVEKSVVLGSYARSNTSIYGPQCKVCIRFIYLVLFNAASKSDNEAVVAVSIERLRCQGLLNMVCDFLDLLKLNALQKATSIYRKNH